MNLNRTKKLFSMVCVCSMLTIGSAQAAFAGPSTGYESDMVATVAADLSIYADEDENSEVVAMAEKGESYDVVGKADDSWIKVAAGEMEGYLKVQSSVMLSKAEEAAASRRCICRRAEQSLDQRAVSQLCTAVCRWTL